jgi:hypothetical protein
METCPSFFPTKSKQPSISTGYLQLTLIPQYFPSKSLRLMILPYPRPISAAQLAEKKDFSNQARKK